MGIFKKAKKEERAVANSESINNNLGLESIIFGDVMTKEKALQIPSVAGAIQKIAETIARLPVKLYKIEEDMKISEVKDDIRTELLNVDTKDTLSTADFWKALVEDYYLGKGAFFYINKQDGKIESLNYVDERRISICSNQDPIFKDCNIQIEGSVYKPFDFVKIMRKTKDGYISIPICEENSRILTLAYDSLKFENDLVKKGGNKKGFFKSKNRLGENAIKELKNAVENLYSNSSTERAVILNEGMDFKETSATSVEMQLNENKKTNADEIFMIFGFPASVIKGGASQTDKDAFNGAVTNLLNIIESALDKDLLLEKEKKSFYFAFDTKELLRGSIKERFDAYATAIEKNFMRIDEVRKIEDLDPLGFNFIKLGLGDVLLNPETEEVYTPNTNAITKLKN